MPELPEVETVRRVLETEILNKKITGIEIFYDKIIDGDKDYFINNVVNHYFKEISRIGKYLIFKLDDDNYILSHLRMEGKYFYEKNDFPINKHIHLIFYFDNGYKLMYQDVRKFGRLEYKNNSDLYITPPLSLLGYEPFKRNYDDLFNKLKNKHIPIKSALLDQHILLGLGNIYVDEVLFSAKINPLRIASSITKAECQKIIDEAEKIFNKAIEYKGTTIRSYTSSLGVSGQYQIFLNVHTKKECPICKCSLEIVKVGGRTTYYCPNCQK